MTTLERRILDISYKYQLSHIGSCLTAVSIIDEIYQRKQLEDKFVLSCGHAGVALYVVLEKYSMHCITADELYENHGVHPNKDEHIDCSTGSLGQGLPIALGMALADRSRNVYCLISDGECSEGSIYEALNVKEKYSISNLIIYMNWNEYGAYDKIGGIWEALPGEFNVIPTDNQWFMQRYGQEAHYKILNQQEYEKLCNSNL